MMKPFVALVTGAASGIGKATARKLASRGITVLMADRQRDAGEAAAEKLRKEFRTEIKFHHVDITQEIEVKGLVREAASLTGRLDYAANCAGIAETVADEEESITTEWFDKVHAVNTKGVWLCQKFEALQMRQQEPRTPSYEPASQIALPGQRGSIVNVASISGLLSMGLAAYTPSKHAALAITKTGAKFYGPAGIRINALCPGWTVTPMTNRNYGDTAKVGTVEYENSAVNKSIMLGRMAFPEEQANVISFLLSDESCYMNGSYVVADGGFHGIQGLGAG